MDAGVWGFLRDDEVLIKLAGNTHLIPLEGLMNVPYRIFMTQ